MSKSDALALVGFLLLTAGLHWKGLFLGQVYNDEDVSSYFFTARSRLFALAHGREAWSWWDPLVQLGMPRLADPQYSYFSPLSQLFYWLEPTRAWAVYPFVANALLLFFTYGLMRSLELEPIPAAFGALSWFFVGIQLYALQQPAIYETILWLPATLACWEMHRHFRLDNQRLDNQRLSGWLVLFCLGLLFELWSGYTVQQLGNFCFLMLWIGAEALSVRSPRLAAEAIAAVAVALSIASFQLLGVAEISGQTSRILVQADQFSQNYQQTPLELLAYLVREIHLFVTLPKLHYAPLYPQDPGLAGISLVLALLAFKNRSRRAQLKIVWGLAVLFALGSLGTGGGVLPLLLWLVPPLKVLRSSFRLISMATLALSMAAGIGCQTVIKGRLRLLPVLWLLALGMLLDYPYLTKKWTDPGDYRVPEALAQADSRVYFDWMHAIPRPSPFLMNAPMLAGKCPLELQDPLVLRRTFEGIFYSQIEPRNWDKIHLAIDNANLVPFNFPSAPLVRAFGLRSVLLPNLSVARLDGGLPSQWVASRVVPLKDDSAAHEMAFSRSWDPATTALVEEPLDLSPSNATLRVLEDTPDRQTLLVDGSGLLIESSAFYPGWTCMVDGTAARILPVDIGLRGVVLQPGRHRVVFKYAPSWLPWSLALAGLGLLSLISYAVVAAKGGRELVQKTTTGGAADAKRTMGQ